MLFKPSYERGLYKILQRAVHLITFEREEVRTEPENFNFIFKNYADDDSYDGLYEVLPSVMLFLSHVIEGLFERMCAKDPGARTAFQTRSLLGFLLLSDDSRWADQARAILGGLPKVVGCPSCREPLVLTKHNMARILLSESFRCKSCGQTAAFPFSYIF